ncbi:hypothetical protein [Mesorhizobium sp. INR15]|uniref:hypothetical protein n=1 Tax=Mesorhizobium sp. INR15 TaxID=2654248 RepID=UPI00189641F5|nr:hypothetical protein [Mesorhizobium sp. INR15]QPC89726.1 hypothetical protein GA829_03490 [Mesorhizobium sp. INR15]
MSIISSMTWPMTRPFCRGAPSAATGTSTWMQEQAALVGDKPVKQRFKPLSLDDAGGDHSHRRSFPR